MQNVKKLRFYNYLNFRINICAVLYPLYSHPYSYPYSHPYSYPYSQSLLLPLFLLLLLPLLLLLLLSLLLLLHFPLAPLTPANPRSNPSQGLVYVAANATIDYELTRRIVLTVEASDSVFDASVRRRSTASLYVSISDANDNRPRFRRSSLSVRRVTVETSASGGHLATVEASDADSGANGELVFSIEDGNERGERSGARWQVGGEGLMWCRCGYC